MKQNKINQLFNNCFNIIINLSDISVINFINGVFNKDFSIDSTVTHYFNENIQDNLERNFSNYLVGIDDKKFTIEVRISDDNQIMLIMLDSNYYDAISDLNPQNTKSSFVFNYPKILILEGNNIAPDECIINSVFGENEALSFEIKAPTIKFFNMSIDEINKNRMVILLPFYLLKLRKEISKNKSLENALLLKDLINNGLIKSIIDCEKSGCITIEDRVILIKLIKRIYDELYGDIDIFADQRVIEELDRELVFEFDKIKAEKENGIKQMLIDNIPIEKIKLYLHVTDEEIENIKTCMVL